MYQVEFPDGSHTNPILDTRMYQVEFPDGSHAEYAANVIAENMYAQCDPAGNQYMLLRAIIDHQRDETAVTHENQWVTVNGRQHRVKTTKGWKLCVEFKDGSTSWIRLAEMKESFPVDTAEYAVAVDKEKGNTLSTDGMETPKFRWLCTDAMPYHLRHQD